MESGDNVRSPNPQTINSTNNCVEDLEVNGDIP
jgi:hypothetical protein